MIAAPNFPGKTVVPPSGIDQDRSVARLPT